jgi:hypothetical protein
MALGFNIPLSASPDQLKKDLDQAVKLSNSASKKMADSTDTISAAQKYAMKQYDDAIVKTSQLAKKYGETSNEALKAAAQAANLRLKLEGLSKPMSTLVVGANGVVSRGFNPLSNSINQLGREMPAFANSMQTGFMAISNNIPAFTDAIAQIKRANAELAASGQPVQSVFGQITKSLFSFNTLISVGVTALTIYGPKLVELTRDWWNNRNAVDANAKSYKVFELAATGATNAINSQIEALKKSNTQLHLELQAKQLGLSVDATKAQNVASAIAAKGREIEQLKQEQKALNTNLYTGKVAYTQKEDNIIALREEIRLMQKWQNELYKSSNLQASINQKGVNSLPVTFRFANAGEIGTKGLDMSKSISDATKNMVRNIKPIPLENFLKVPEPSFFESFAIKFSEGIDRVSGILEQGAAMIGTSFTNALGASFVTGELDMKGIYQMFADLANAIAIQLIAIGTPMLFVPGTQSLGLAYVGAGAALGIVAGAASAAASGSGGGGSSPAPTITEPRGMSTYFGNDSRAGSGTFSDRVYGRDLLLVIDGQGRVKRR